MRLLLFFTFLLLETTTSAYTLDEVLQMSRTQIQKANLLNTQKQRYLSQSKSIEQAFDTKLTFDYLETTDEGELNQVSDGKERWQVKRNLEMTRYFPTGTALSVSSLWQQQKLSTDFPLSSIDPFQLPRFNPVHEFRYGISIKQDLWRNFGASLITLQRKLSENQSISPGRKAQIEMQNRQFEVASLYLQIIGLNQKHFLALQLEEESQNFLQLTKGRKRLGRADDVDVATAETELIRRSGMTLDIRLHRDALKIELAHLVLGPGRTLVRPLPRTFERLRPTPSPQGTLQKSFRQRHDLRMLQELAESLKVKSRFLKEDSKPEIALFAGLHKRGLGDDFTGATKDAGQGTITTLGVEFSWNLEDTKYAAETKAVGLHEAEFKLEENLLRRSLTKEIEVTIQKLKGSKLQSQQARNQIQSLSKKVRAERVKLQQARSDRAALSRYNIEILLAKMEEWDALANGHLLQNRIRWLCHDFPAP